MQPRRPKLDDDSRDWLKWAGYIAMQAMAVAFVIKKFNDTGVLDAIWSYGEVYNPWREPCGWLDEGHFVLLSNRIVLPYGVLPGFVHVQGSMIASVNTGAVGADRHRIASRFLESHKSVKVLDFEDHAISPGLIDVHVHMNEPGRESWEGFRSGTFAAAAGGVTTVIDMPLNSRPAAVTAEGIKNKSEVAWEKSLVDVGMWGGLVPQNAHNPEVLRGMVRAGALGFKAFMSPSGMDDFDNVSVADVAAALPVIKQLGVPLLIHAELTDADVPGRQVENERAYSTWLVNRPKRFEARAIRALIELLRNDTTPAVDGFRIHIVHLSNADMLPELAAAKAEGLPLSVEACPHYLELAAEDVPEADPRFKCAPPIRERENQERLWAGLRDGIIDSLSSDHSPAPYHLKVISGKMLDGWAGIAGLQYNLPASWNKAEAQGLNLSHLAAVWSAFPARLTGLSKRKGALRSGMDADIVVWSPEQLADTDPLKLWHRHKLTPYTRREMRGRVVATFVRGRLLFDAERGPWQESVCNKVLLK